MTSSTRLPTFWPTSPVSQPLMTWPTPIGVVYGWLRAQEESNTFLVRQMTPVYCTISSSPLFTFGPVPAIRGLTSRVFGGVLAGMVMTGALPDAVVTVGSEPPPFEVCAPGTPAVLLYDLSRSMTKTSVSVPLTPICEFPCVPKACLGGITASTRLPIDWPTRAVSRPGIIWPANSVGPLEPYVLPSSLCVVPLQS